MFSSFSWSKSCLTLVAAVTFLLSAQISDAAPLASANDIVPGNSFDRIVIINMENRNYASVKSIPYWQELTKKGRLLGNYNGITHPSQPNYVAQIFGSTDGVFLDFTSSVSGSNVVDLLEKKGISWKAYMENYPGNKDNCYVDSDGSNNLYRRKHNPFMVAENVRENPQRCAKIVNADEFEQDLNANNLPQYSYYTPNMNNDGHDTTLEYATAWLKGFLEPKLANPDFLHRTLIVVTFDEAENYFIRNQVYTVLLGQAAGTPGLVDNTEYNHYSLLRTVEDNWNLGTLGRKDVKAKGFIKLNQ
ncbi:phosphoesterase family-domain-containing protein [Syncephalis fuscata]|nr:phosphoesterase family-domain-containing protein [Syncephalis fuscata]